MSGGLHGERTDRTYRRAGFGAAVRRGSRPAIVVVDLTLGFTDDSYPSGADLTDVVAATARLIEAGRAAGVPIVFTAIAYTPAEAAGESAAWLQKAPWTRPPARISGRWRPWSPWTPPRWPMSPAAWRTGG